MTFSKSNPFTSAVSAIRTKRVVPVDWSSEDWAQYVPSFFRQQAFFSAHTDAAARLNGYKKYMEDFLEKNLETITTPEGGTVEALKAGGRSQFVSDLKALYGGSADEGTGSIQTLTSTRRAELIFDTQQASAWGRGQWEEGNSPEILDYFPGQRFIRAGFVQVPRELHEQHRDEVHLKDDLQFWMAMNSEEIGGFGVPYPPFGYNSQMDVEDVTREDCIALGLIDENTQITPPDRAFNDVLQKSLEDMDPDIKRELLDTMGTSVYVDEQGILKMKGE